MKLAKLISASGIAALVLSAAATSAVTFTATPAFAERGERGNGNDRDRGNDRNDRSERDNSRDNTREGNGRGAIARELRGLNAANANQRALENASPNSMPGKLYIYQQAQTDLAAAEAAEAAAAAEYERLANLTDEEIEEEFPDDGYDIALEAAEIVKDATAAQTLEAQTTADTSLDTLTEGRVLSQAAMDELNGLLGL